MLRRTLSFIDGKLQSAYDRLLTAACATNGIAVPPRTLRYYVNLTGYQYARAVRRFVGDKRRVLIIGDAGGRDYYFLTMAGKEVFVVDIAAQSLPDFLVADAAALPFREDSFDAVVMAEVIEHLIDDYTALQGVRRVLRPDGVLVLTVPFFHDDAEHHVRIHSPRTIERLLRAAGFSISEYIEKGGGFTLLERSRLYAYLFHAVNYVAFHLTGQTLYAAWNELLARGDCKLGARRNSLWHRWSRHHGAFIRCVKGQQQNFHELNRRDFQYLHGRASH